MATPSYGLDAELAAKAAAKFDPAIEKEVCEWLEKVSGVPKEGTTAEWLHSGKVLCMTANAIKPGFVKKINTMKAPFKERENISYFQNFMRECGVTEISMFGTDDLYDEKNMGSVLVAIYGLGGCLQTNMPNFEPKLGVAVTSHVHDGKRAAGPATQTGGLKGAMEVQSLYAGKREVAAGGIGVKEGVADCAGLDSDIAAKRAAELAALKPLEDDITGWIGTISGDPRGGQSLNAWLKSGQVLCSVANKIKPGAVPNVNTMSTAFKERENINYFQTFMRECGLPESSMFGTDDLYEEKDLPTFIKSINAFAGAVQTKHPNFGGPKLGAAMSHAMAGDVKREGLTATSQQESMQRAMQVERPKDTGIAAGANAGK